MVIDLLLKVCRNMETVELTRPASYITEDGTLVPWRCVKCHFYQQGLINVPKVSILRNALIALVIESEIDILRSYLLLACLVGPLRTQRDEVERPDHLVISLT